MCILVIKLSTEWPLLAFLTLTWISSSYNVNVLITLETRRSPHQNWTLHRDRQSVWKFSPGIHNVTSSRGLDQNGQNSHSRASWELLDEPQRQNGGFRGQSYTSRPAPGRIPYLPYGVTQQQIGQRAASSKGVPGSPVYNSIPPWYADKYRRMPRDESDDSLSGMNRYPWNYQPKCRSCGRPMLQDSFCSDDFVLLVYVYKNVDASLGDKEYVVYVYQVYKDVRHQLRPNQYNRIIYRCDWFHDGPVLGQFYLITGIYLNGSPSVDSCSWKAPWSEVTRQQERYLRSRYSLFCGICKIQRVLRLDSKHHNRRDTCYVAHSPNPKEMTCRDRFSICRFKRPSRSCAFNKRTPYDICEKWLSHK